MKVPHLADIDMYICTCVCTHTGSHTLLLETTRTPLILTPTEQKPDTPVAAVCLSLWSLSRSAPDAHCKPVCTLRGWPARAAPLLLCTSSQLTNQGVYRRGCFFLVFPYRWGYGLTLVTGGV